MQELGNWCCLPGSEGEGHEDALNSRARSSQAKLHSPVIHQIELHISRNEFFFQVLINITHSDSV